MFDLEEGDALFIPAGWFHEVSSWPSDGSGCATREGGRCGDAGSSALRGSETSCDSESEPETESDTTRCLNTASESAAQGESGERHSRAYSNRARHDDNGGERTRFHAAINFWFKPPSTTT